MIIRNLSNERNQTNKNLLNVGFANEMKWVENGKFIKLENVNAERFLSDIIISTIKKVVREI